MSANVTGVRIDTSGVATTVDLGPDTAEGLRREIDCRWFDRVSLLPELDMWVDDEGLCVADPVINVTATAIANAFEYPSPIAGNAVFVSSEGPETTSLSDHYVKLILRMAAMVAAGES
jgi:hypothetical protein